MINNDIVFEGVLKFEGVDISVNEYGKRYVSTPSWLYEKGEPFNIEAEMEIDKKKYEAMNWYNKTFCNASNK